MQFVQPIKFEAAVKKLGAKSPIGAKLSSKQWSAVPLALRERAIWSATIESVRFLQAGKNDLADFLEANRDPNTGALKVGSKAKFIENMRRRAIAEGLGPLDPDDAGTIKDIRSERRLGLIFEVNAKAAKSFGNRQQGLDPDVLNEFPGQKLIRERDVTQERTSHIPFENFVALKTDLQFWLRINVDFGVPWAPWGWGCGHDVEDVDRDTTDALGLTEPGQTIAGGDDENFNQHLKASVKNLDPELQRFLKEKFGNQIDIRDGEARWNPGAPSRFVPPPPPAPVPHVVPPSGGSSAARNWKSALDTLAKDYSKATGADRFAIVERARQAVQIPEAQRRGVALENRGSRTVAAIAQAGNEAIARFVNPAFTAKTSVTVNQIRARRAFHRSGGIYINSHTSQSTAAHEIMHGIEQQNPDLLKAAAEFLLSRRREFKSANTIEEPQPLRRLTGIRAYQSDEIAIEDKWVERGGSVYAGKVYKLPGATKLQVASLRATEVLTMGIERLLANPIEFFQNDPDWFTFIVEKAGIGPSLSTQHSELSTGL